MIDLKNSFIVNGKITTENVNFYQDYGYLIGSDFFEAFEILELKKETAAIFRGSRGAIDGLALVKDSESDSEILKKYVAIHFPHKISDVVRNYLFHNKVVDVLTKIVSPNVKCMQSMLFVKAPGKQGQSWHQDEYFIPTRDKSLVGAWIAIDDATIENGCLWIIPGSHKPGSIKPRIKNEDTNYADVETLDLSAYAKEEIIPVEVKSGSIVFFNGYVYHSSLSNKTSDNFRTALVNHYMSAESMLPWDQDGKLPATEDIRDILMIAGEDPYKHKPTVDVNKPFLRQEKLNAKVDQKYEN